MNRAFKVMFVIVMLGVVFALSWRYGGLSSGNLSGGMPPKAKRLDDGAFEQDVRGRIEVAKVDSGGDKEIMASNRDLGDRTGAGASSSTTLKAGGSIENAKLATDDSLGSGAAKMERSDSRQTVSSSAGVSDASSEIRVANQKEGTSENRTVVQNNAGHTDSGVEVKTSLEDKSKPVLVAPSAGGPAITGEIPRANVIIYLKSRIIMLRDYATIVRRYRDIATPADIVNPKSKSDDNRAPHGKYYITAKRIGDNGPELEIGYPNERDAAKAQTSGLIDAETYKAIVNASKGNTSPPQDTPLGGGVVINGTRSAGITTQSGFAIHPGHMEELYKAVGIGRPVVIVNK